MTPRCRSDRVRASAVALKRQLLAADMAAAAQATRVYDDYLREVAKTRPDDLAVLAVSLIEHLGGVGTIRA